MGALIGKFFLWIIGAVVLAGIIWFALVNRHDVMLDLTPLAEGLTLPLVLIVYPVFVLGVIIGALAAWASSLKYRYRARHESKRADRAEAELASAKEEREESDRRSSRTAASVDSAALPGPHVHQ